MKVHPHGKVGGAEPGCAMLPAAAADALLVAALETDMSRVGMATTMAYLTITRRSLALPLYRDRS